MYVNLFGVSGTAILKNFMYVGRPLMRIILAVLKYTANKFEKHCIELWGSEVIWKENYILNDSFSGWIFSYVKIVKKRHEKM